MAQYSKSIALTLDADAETIYGAPNLTGTPERNLLMAILERAILDFVGNQQKEIDAAEEWLFPADEDEIKAEVFSFPWICQQLNLDMSKVSRTVEQMPKRGNRRIAPWYFMRNQTG